MEVKDSAELFACFENWDYSLEAEWPNKKRDGKFWRRYACLCHKLEFWFL